jgi:hypothetical protein
MKVDGVCKTIYSTSGDEELSINGTLEPGGTIVSPLYIKNTHDRKLGPFQYLNAAFRDMLLPDAIPPGMF